MNLSGIFFNKVRCLKFFQKLKFPSRYKPPKLIPFPTEKPSPIFWDKRKPRVKCIGQVFTFVLEASTATASTLCVCPLQTWMHSALPLSRDHYKQDRRRKIIIIIIIIIIITVIIVITIISYMAVQASLDTSTGTKPNVSLLTRTQPYPAPTPPAPLNKTHTHVPALFKMQTD